VRIVAVEQFGAGPFATLYLVDMGAEVIKIEDPSAGGDVGRYVPPGQRGTDSLYFESFNRGKRSLALDLRNEATREVVERELLAEYDHPQLGTVRSVGAPFTVGEFRPHYRPGPALDADRESLLAWLGYNNHQADQLVHRGAFGAQP
jgi:crotonobetainyl-CoA:carnitine CoA-transferase CaiB-like acyl-CoA transferase